MTTPELGNNIWRDFVTAGVASSGANEPKKSKIRQWSTYIESLTMAAGYGNTVWFSTKVALDADLAHDAGAPAVVYADTAADNNGIYLKSGASGAGSWSQIITYLPGYQFVKATDAGAGTANAIVATSSPRVAYTDGVQLIRLNIFETNTAVSPTVSFDGGPDLIIKTSSDNDVLGGGLVANTSVLGMIDQSGTVFRLLSDQASAAIQVGAESAAARAESALASLRSALASLRLAVATLSVIADGDGNGGGTSITSELQTLVDAVSATGGGDILIPHTGTGIYLMSTTLEMKSNVTVRVADGVKIDARRAPLIRWVGSLGSEMNTNAHKTRGDTTIATVDPHNLEVGDYAFIISQRNSLSVDAGDWRLGKGTTGAPYAYFAEWLQVAEIYTDTFFRTSNALIYPSYRTNDSQETETERTRSTIAKVSPVENSHWLGGEFLATNSSQVFRSLWAVNCTVQDALIHRAFAAGHSVYWQASWECFAKKVRNTGDPSVVWDYDLHHGKRNRFVTNGTQDCGFLDCYDEYSAQSIDFSYGGTTPYPSTRSYAIGCTTFRCFEGVTSHPACYQERWEGNKWLDCVRDGIVVRGRHATVSGNLITSSSELVEVTPGFETVGGGSTAIDIYNGHAVGANITNNTISGFRYGFNIRDGSTDARFSVVDAFIEGNRLSNCYGALTTFFSTTVPNGTNRGINYINNTHRQMQRYVLNLAQYSAGVNCQNNVLHGDFLNEAGDTSASFFNASSNCPSFTIEGNRWYRTPGGNGGVSLRVANIASVTDTTTYSALAHAKKGRLRNNFVSSEMTAKFTVGFGAYQLQDDFSDVNTNSTNGAYSGLFAGEYTPVLTNSANVDSSSVGLCQFVQVGPIVSVSGSLQINATASGSQVTVYMSLPVDSTFSVTTDCAGTFNGSSANSNGRVLANISNGLAQFVGVPASSGTVSYGFSFTYRIK